MRKLFFVVICLLAAGTLSAQSNQLTVTVNRANVRVCPETSCQVLTTLSRGATITVVDTVQGQRVSGSTSWYKLDVEGQDGYLHSSLARQATPTPAPRRGLSSPPAATAAPASAGYICNCAKTCSQMTCDEAYFQLRQCGCSRRDGDKDGVPCENVCPGG